MSSRHDGRRLRVAFAGAGWIVPKHLAALDRLDRVDVVGTRSVVAAAGVTG